MAYAASRDCGGRSGEIALIRLIEIQGRQGALHLDPRRGSGTRLHSTSPLTGLALDGGLYVPETWPAIDAATVAGFARRPYADVACDVVSAVYDRPGIAELAG